jgi:hypothetical protein
MQNKGVGYLWIIALACFLFTSPVFAQNKAEEDEIPPAEQVSIETTDGVTLRCTWYAGTEGKSTVPIILVHDWAGDRTEMQPLAEHLQQAGHAVIVPDLRGHGGSTKAAGMEDPITHTEFKKAQVASMVIDIDTCKRFLMRKNNAAELNIEMLTVVANHNTSIHAVNWAASDWAWPTLADGTKQGQDVKALFLISPTKRFKSLSMNSSLKMPCMSGKGGFKPIIFTVLYGRDHDASSRDAKSIRGLVLKGREQPEDLEGLEEDEFWSRATSFLYPLASSGSGSDLLEGETLERIKRNVAGVIEKTIVDNSEDFPWQDRSDK